MFSSWGQWLFAEVKFWASVLSGKQHLTGGDAHRRLHEKQLPLFVVPSERAQ